MCASAVFNPSSMLPLVSGGGHRRCSSEFCDGARLIVFVARWGFLASGTCTTDIALASRLLARFGREFAPFSFLAGNGLVDK